MSDIYGSPAVGAAAVTPNDATVVNARALYVGTGGNLKVTMANGSVVTFSTVLSGSWCPIGVRIVWSTGTSASDIVALF
jgi:hypothetical protein